MLRHLSAAGPTGLGGLGGLGGFGGLAGLPGTLDRLQTILPGRSMGSMGPILLAHGPCRAANLRLSMIEQQGREARQ